MSEEEPLQEKGSGPESEKAEGFGYSTRKETDRKQEYVRSSDRFVSAQSQRSSWPGGSSSARSEYRPKSPHPKETSILVLGILGLLCCGLCAPIAWHMGSEAKHQSGYGSPYEFTAAGQAGYILGIIGTILLIGGLLVWLWAAGQTAKPY